MSQCNGCKSNTMMAVQGKVFQDCWAEVPDKLRPKCPCVECLLKPICRDSCPEFDNLLEGV